MADPAKLRAYLLFTREGWPLLGDALLAVARDGDAAAGEASGFGQKYLVRGIVRGPAGRAAVVVTAWIALRGDDVPRLVTAHPGEAPR